MGSTVSLREDGTPLGQRGHHRHGEHDADHRHQTAHRPGCQDKQAQEQDLQTHAIPVHHNDRQHAPDNNIVHTLIAQAGCPIASREIQSLSMSNTRMGKAVTAHAIPIPATNRQGGARSPTQPSRACGSRAAAQPKARGAQQSVRPNRQTRKAMVTITATAIRNSSTVVRADVMRGSLQKKGLASRGPFWFEHSG